MLASGQPAAAEDDILVAIAGPMTGQYAQFGRAMKFGGRQAVDKINNDGGIAGRKLQLLVEDDGCDKAQATAAAQRLVAKQVALVVGHHCASASIAAAPIYAAAGVIMISPGTTDRLLTDKRAGPTIFRLAPRTDSQGAAIGSYMARAFAGKRVAILHDRTVVGIELATQTKRAMNAAGLTEVLHSGFVAGERDYSQLARDLRAHKIDAVFLGAYPMEAWLILRALRAEGLSTVVVGNTLLNTKEFIEPAFDLLDEMVLQPDGAPRDTDHKEIKEFDPHDHVPERGRALQNAQAAIEVWAQAARADAGGGSTPAASVHAQVLQTGKFASVIGEVGFDKKGDATVPFYKMYVWKKGGIAVPAP